MTSPAATRPLLLSPGEAARFVGFSRARFYRELRADPALARCSRTTRSGGRCFNTADLERWAAQMSRAG